MDFNDAFMATKTSRKAKAKPRKGQTLGVHYPSQAQVDAIKEKAARYRRKPSDFARIAIEIGMRAIDANPALMFEPN